VDNIEVDIKNCICDAYKETIVKALDVFGPLNDADHQTFLNAYTPVRLPHSYNDMIARAQGGRSGWWLRRKLPDYQDRPHNSITPYKRQEIAKFITDLGL